MLQDVRLPRGHRALVTVLEEKPEAAVAETALLSEDALGEDWLKAEEDEAWPSIGTVVMFAFLFLIYRTRSFDRQSYWRMPAVTIG